MKTSIVTVFRMLKNVSRHCRKKKRLLKLKIKFKRFKVTHRRGKNVANYKTTSSDLTWVTAVPKGKKSEEFCYDGDKSHKRKGIVMEDNGTWKLMGGKEKEDVKENFNSVE